MKVGVILSECKSARSRFGARSGPAPECVTSQVCQVTAPEILHLLPLYCFDSTAQTLAQALVRHQGRQRQPCATALRLGLLILLIQHRDCCLRPPEPVVTA